MPVTYEKSLARFAEVCTVEEAMEVQEWLGRHKAPRIDLSACTHLHTAVLQVLMAARPQLAAAPEDPFLRRWVAPLLDTGRPRPRRGDPA